MGQTKVSQQNFIQTVKVPPVARFLLMVHPSYPTVIHMMQEKNMIISSSTDALSGSDCPVLSEVGMGILTSLQLYRKL